MRNFFSSIFIFFTLLTALFTFAQEEVVLPDGVRTIVIDPGHGGHDPGCHGEHSKEKDIALAIGLKLGEYIGAKYPEIKIIYTRKTDVFVSLDDRAKLANDNNADLFICIHANAASPAAKGVETYVLGLHRTESQQKIAERENSTIYLEEDNGEKYKDFDLSPDAIIARNLQLSVFLQQSISFAAKIQAQFKNLGRYDRGVKQAGFLVLYKTTMPSVLIETGFLTHKEEEKFLANPINQQKMANSIFKAFQEYKSEIEGVNTLIVDAKEIADLPDSVLIPVDTIPVQEMVEEELEPTAQIDLKDKYVFKVQIETSTTKVALNDPRFKGLTVEEYFQNKLFKYTVGNYVMDIDAALALRKEMISKGYTSAFVVAFKNGKRVSITAARAAL
ncbi:N-acetylmuramoyl-L-alanine amidase [Lishizhenia tianjinensis]|uniref:N-acetylmuramoyl-L-alanine amidase n=1 Tax=Lishizhenia tianjinensis TaxID=477690 RepID=A0A1I6Z1H1_9FLAO|nr:N-acetylmuramoyl-L-alanine amidase [Lishizhenia tianjinensis]SFT56522.1 N-acetylmuramoyl-L-alanine amidase [Lishizhenia tianjinensis]